jgi:hypothetical protein
MVAGLSGLFGLSCSPDRQARQTNHRNQISERDERPGVNGKKGKFTEGGAARNGWQLGRLLEDRGDQFQSLFCTVAPPIVGQFLSVQFG